MKESTLQNFASLHDYNVEKKCIITFLLYTSFIVMIFMPFVQKMNMEDKRRTLAIKGVDQKYRK